MMTKAELIFSIITSVFSVAWSFRNQYNLLICWFAAQETFVLILSMLKAVVINIYVKIVHYWYIISQEIKEWKRIFVNSNLV